MRYSDVRQILIEGLAAGLTAVLAVAILVAILVSLAKVMTSLGPVPGVRPHPAVNQVPHLD